MPGTRITSNGRRARTRAHGRAGRDAVLAHIAEIALASRHIDVVIAEGSRALRGALAADEVAVYEVVSAGAGVQLRRRGSAGPVAFRSRPPSSVHRLLELALAGRAPVVEERDAPPCAGGARGAVAAVALRGGGTAGAAPWGVLEVRARARRGFDEDDLSLIAAAAWVLASAAARAESDERLAAQLAFLRAITGDLEEGVYAVDRDGRVTYVNPAAARMLGWSEQELIGRQVDEVVHHHQGGRRDAERCGILQVIRTGVPYHSDGEASLRRDGTTFPISCSAAPLREDGRIAGAVVAFRDFTEPVRRDADARFLAGAARALADSIDWEVTLGRVARIALPRLGDLSFVVVLSRDGSPRAVAAEASDPAMAETARALLARHPIDLRAAHGTGHILRTGEAELIPDVEATLARDPAPPEALSALRRAGLRSYLGVPLRAHDRVLGALAFGLCDPRRRYTPGDVAVAEDLASRCAIALENATLHLEARTAVRARDDLLAIVSHDLKAPLATVALGARVIEKLAPRDAQGAGIRDSAGSIRRSALRMDRLIGDLLDLAAVDTGKLACTPAPVDLAAVAREAVDAFAAQAAASSVSLAVAAADDLPLGRCDRGRVLQVLSNLLANAIQVTPPGGRVTLGVAARDAEAVLSVSDTGPGISAHELPALFERYWRGAGTRYPGSGLGLAIAKGIVDAHGGQIWVETSEGQGSTFRFTLPVAGRGADAG